MVWWDQVTREVGTLNGAELDAAGGCFQLGLDSQSCLFCQGPGSVGVPSLRDDTPEELLNPFWEKSKPSTFLETLVLVSEFPAPALPLW